MLLVELDGVVEQVEDDAAEIERDLHRVRRVRDPRRDERRRSRAPLEGAQVGVRGDGPDRDGLLRAGRRRPANAAAARSCARSRSSPREHGLRVGNVFHAGDGNLHPLVLYDAAAEGETERARELAEAILDACLDAGGSLTGEHGVGMDKACSMPRMFSERDLAASSSGCAARSTRTGICNPGKVIPTPRLCGEVPGPYRIHALERIGVAERL